MDVPTTFPGGVGQPDYNPVNYDGKYVGPIRFVMHWAIQEISPLLKCWQRLG